MPLSLASDYVTPLDTSQLTFYVLICSGMLVINVCTCIAGRDLLAVSGKWIVIYEENEE